MILALLLATVQPAEPAQWVGFPLLGGDSDLGFVMGLVGIVSQPKAGQDSYLWQVTVQTSTSVKHEQDQLEWPLQRHYLRLDYPRLVGDMDLWAEARFERLLDAGYFGIASGDAGTPPEAPHPTYYQYPTTEPHVRATLSRRLKTTSWRFTAGLDLKYAENTVVPGSKLAEDAQAHPDQSGLQPHWTLQPITALEYDSRDHLFWPTQGAFHLFSLRGAPGLLSPNLRFVGASMLMRGYHGLTARDVLAMRLWLDALWGTIPLEELARGGDLRVTRMIGHSRSMRGIPWGRVHAPFKAMASLEYRRRLLRFARQGKRPILVHWSFFAETGRGWQQMEDEGRTAWSVGGGPRFVLGPGVVIRIDTAYSPMAADLSPGPFSGFYVDLNEAF